MRLDRSVFAYLNLHQLKSQRINATCAEVLALIKHVLLKWNTHPIPLI